MTEITGDFISQETELFALQEKLANVETRKRTLIDSVREEFANEVLQSDHADNETKQYFLESIGLGQYVQSKEWKVTLRVTMDAFVTSDDVSSNIENCLDYNLEGMDGNSTYIDSVEEVE